MFHSSVELIGANIEVIVIEPGAHSTNLTGSIDSSIQACWERMSEEDRKKYGKKNFDKSSDEILSFSLYCSITP